MIWIGIKTSFSEMPPPSLPSSPQARRCGGVEFSGNLGQLKLDYPTFQVSRRRKGQMMRKVGVSDWSGEELVLINSFE